MVVFNKEVILYFSSKWKKKLKIQSIEGISGGHHLTLPLAIIQLHDCLN